MPLTNAEKEKFDALMYLIKTSDLQLGAGFSIKKNLDKSEYNILAVALALNHSFKQLYIEQWSTEEKGLEQISEALQTSSHTTIRCILVENNVVNISECTALIGALQNNSLQKLKIDQYKIDNTDEFIMLIEAFTKLFKTASANKEMDIHLHKITSPEIKNLESDPKVKQALAQMIETMYTFNSILVFNVAGLNDLSISHQISTICKRNQIDRDFKLIELTDEKNLNKIQFMGDLKKINTQFSLLLDAIGNEEFIQPFQTKIKKMIIQLKNITPSQIGFALEECHKEMRDLLKKLIQLTYTNHVQGEEIENLKNLIMKVNDDLKVEAEKEHIKSGWYQHQLYEFTYVYRDSKKIHLNGETVTKTLMTRVSNNINYQICLLMNEPAFRCTVSIPEKMTDPLEVQINFFGTIDFASQSVALDKGGPGQELIKKHEGILLEQLNYLLEQISLVHPGVTFRLRIAGHSLGGALAKGFTYTVQRGIAVQNKNPEEIIKSITDNLDKHISSLSYLTTLSDLERQLKHDKENGKFHNLTQLKKIEGITLYALGAPGISKETDLRATLMTYYHDEIFLHVYHHQHEEDIITRFGETEFLSGAELPPHVKDNLHIIYSLKITDEDMIHKPLPFPGCNKKVMAAHNKLIFGIAEVDSIIVDLATSNLSNKAQFHPLKYALYRGVNNTAVFLSQSLFKNMEALSSLPSSKSDFPVLGEKAFSHNKETENLLDDSARKRSPSS